MIHGVRLGHVLRDYCPRCSFEERLKLTKVRKKHENTLIEFALIFSQSIAPMRAVDALRESSVASTDSGLANVLIETLLILGVLLAPFVAFALVIHWLELFTQRRLAERFGWKSVLWTGWLGTPIHELSHVFMCRVFNHDVEEVALFEPDRESGRLGFVRHSFRVGNRYQEIGTLFIGIAPLLGGSVVLAGLVWLFFPEAAQEAVALSKVESGNLVDKTFSIIWGMCKSILSVGNFFTPRFWVFLYLVLCVGSHMAPSPSDYRGASRGAWIVGGALVLAALVLAIFGADARQLGVGMLSIMGPLFAIFGLAILLCALSAVLVYGVTLFFPQRFQVG